MVIDATKRFAKRTALWLLNSGLTRPQLEARLKMFPEEHVELIGQQVKELRGQPVNPK